MLLLKTIAIPVIPNLPPWNPEVFITEIVCIALF